MQISMQLAAVAFIAIALQAGTPRGMQACRATETSVNSSAKVLLNYTWYLDEDMTIPTGTVSSVNTELSRLRNLYPAYVFSASPGFGLSQFEFGDHPVFSYEVIYSNM